MNAKKALCKMIQDVHDVMGGTYKNGKCTEFFQFSIWYTNALGNRDVAFKISPFNDLYGTDLKTALIKQSSQYRKGPAFSCP